jgi:hypothetical protein
LSKIDELIPIAERLRKVQDDLTQWIQKYEPPGLKTETPEPKPSGKWQLIHGQKGDFEILKDMETEEYRFLKQIVDNIEHPIAHEFKDGTFTIWLMQDGVAIGRKRRQSKQ